MIYRYVMLFLFGAALFDAGWSYSMGMMWLDEGYGLNPMIASPLAFISLCVGLHCLKEFIMSFEVIQAVFNHGYSMFEAEPDMAQLDTLACRAHRIIKLDRLRAGRVTEEFKQRMNVMHFGDKR